MNCAKSYFGQNAVRLEGHKTLWSGPILPSRRDAPTPPCAPGPSPHIRGGEGGYGAWGTMREVI